MKRILHVACLMLFSIGLFAQPDTLTTNPPLLPNNGAGGITFEFESNQPVNITDILYVFGTGVTTADLWMRVGGVLHPGATQPNISATNGWAQVITGAPVSGANNTNQVLMDFQGQKIAIPANTRMGFHLAASTTRYQTGTAADPTSYTDGVATIFVNDPIAWGGPAPSPPNNPRRFVGSVIYELGVTGNCTPFTNFAFTNVAGTSADISWTPGAGNTSFKAEYGLAGFTPGTGTVITGTYPGGQPPINLTGLSAQTTYDVYFEEYCNSGTDTVRFPAAQSFTTTKLCAPASNLTASNILATQVDLSWNYPTTANSFDIIYGPVGFDPTTTGTSVTVTGSPYTLTGLNAATSYDAYLVAYCGVTNGYSDTIGPEFFFTNCAITAAPFTEKFDDPTWVASGNNAGNQINPCWTANPDMGQGTEPFKWIPRGTGPTSGNGPLTDFTGGNFMYVEASGSSAGDVAELVTPLIDVSGLTTPALYFMQHRWGGSATAIIADMDVEVSNDFGTTWTNVYSVSGNTQTATGDPWELIFINLGGYTGDTIQVKFIQNGNGCCGDAAIDSVVVDEAPLCPWPTNVAVTGITSTGADFSWTDPSGSSWDIEWGPCGYTQGTGTFVNTSSNPYSATGLAPNTCYDMYIRANCNAAGNGTSDWIGPIVFQTACSPFTAPFSDNFDANASNIIPQCWSAIREVTSGTAAAIETYTFGLPNSTPNHIRMYNGSGLWSNGGRTILISPEFSDLPNGDKRVQFFAYKTSTAVVTMIVGTIDKADTSGVFSPIDTITLGSTSGHQLFIVDVDNAAGYNGTDTYIALAHGMSAAFQTIYVDDFSYETKPLCNPPLITSLSVSASATTANISWGAGSDGDETHIEWGTPGFIPGTGSYVGLDSVPGSVDNYTMSGLSPQTNYDVYIKDSCVANGFSPYIGPINFITACLPQSMTYYESLDNWPVACWDSTQGSAEWSKYVGTGGDNYAVADFWSNSTGIYHLTSPPISISQDAQVSFMWSHLYSTSYPDEKLHVRASVAGTGVWDTILTLAGPNDFNDPTAANTAPGSFVLAEVLLNPAVYTGNDVIIEFVGVSDFGPNCYLNDIYVEPAPMCPKPGGLNANNIQATSADLNWFGPTAATAYEVWYGPQGFYQGSATVGGTKVVSSGTGTTYNLTGLTSNTCYEFLVRTICSAGDSSDWEGPVIFCTPCTPYTAPYFQDFSNSTVGFWDGTDDCWSFVSNSPGASGSAGYSWEVRNTSQTTSGTTTGPDRDNTLWPATGGTFVTADVSGSSTAGPDSTMLVSPIVDISGLTNPEVQYFYHRYGTIMAELHVDVYNGTNWVNGVHSYTSLAGTQTSQAAAWSDSVVDLSPYAGTTNLRVRFRAVTNGCCAGDVAIDDIHFREQPSCIQPNSISNTAITASSATLNWTPAGTGTNFEVSYGPGLTIGNVLSGTRVSVSGATTLNLSGLMPATNYCAFVREICAPGDTSFWTGPTCFATTCVPVAMPYYESFDSWPPVCWDINLGTSPWLHYLNGLDGWAEANFWSVSTGNMIMSSPAVIASTRPQVRFTWSHLANLTSYPEDELIVRVTSLGSGVWDTIARYRSNLGNFNDATASNTAPGNGIEDIIPLDTAYTGDTIVVQFWGNTDFGPDCFINDVYVEQVASCPMPQNLDTTNVTSNSATLNWAAGTPGNTTFEVEYGVGLTFANLGTGTRVLVTGGTSTSLTGLMPATNYCFFVREVCAVGDTSNWAGSFCFNTECQPVVNLPYSTNFEGITTGANVLAWENCWTASPVSGPYWLAQTATGANQGSLGTGPFYDATSPGVAGGRYLILETSTSAGQQEVYSPYINFAGSNSPELEYYYHMYGVAMGTLEVYAEDQQGARTFLDSLVGQQMTAGSDPFLARTVSLSGVTAPIFRLVFVGIRGTNFESDMAIDEVSVYDVGGCPVPTGLASSSVGCDSITVTWNSATGGSILAFGPQGFVPPAGTLTGVVTSPYTITGLNPGTAYDIYVADTCSNDTSNIVGPITVTTTGTNVSAAFTYTFGTAGPNSRTVFFDGSTSVGATSYSWDFGDGNTGTGMNTSNIYNANGSYIVTLTVGSACGVDSISDTVLVEGIGFAESVLNQTLEIYPNPAKTEVNVSFDRVNEKARISLLDLSGKELIVREISNTGDHYSGRLDISNLSDGVYMLQISDGEIVVNRRLIKR